MSEKDKKVIDCYLSGNGVRKTARELNMPASTVHLILKKNNIETRPANPDRSERDKKIVKMYNEGKSSTEVGALFGITYARVLQILHSAGAEVRPDGVRIDIPEEVWEWYLKYESINSISKKTGISGPPIKRFLREHGIDVRFSVFQGFNFPKEEVIKMYEARHTLEEIGERFGVSHETIRRFMAREGIEVRNAGLEKIIVDEEDIIALYKEGVSYEKIAEKYNATGSFISGFLRSRGFRRNSTVIKMTEEMKKEIIKSFESDGLSMKEIAFNVGLSYLQVRNFLSKSGIKIKKEKIKIEEPNYDEDILRLRLQNKKQYEIVDELRISYHELNKAVKRLRRQNSGE